MALRFQTDLASLPKVSMRAESISSALHRFDKEIEELREKNAPASVIFFFSLFFFEKEFTIHIQVSEEEGSAFVERVESWQVQ